MVDAVLDRTGDRSPRRRRRRRPAEVAFVRFSTRGDLHAPRQAEHPGDLGRRHRDLQPVVLQRRADGVPHPEHRPHRRRGRALHRLLRRAELHRRARGVHHRPEPDPHRPHQGRHARRRHRAARRGPHDRHRAQGAGLRHGPVRQEPPRRQGRVPADDARLRRVLRQPLPPQRGGGARARRLSDARRTSRTSASDFGPRGVIHSWANGDGTQRIEDTGPLTSERMETVDEEFLPEARRVHRGTRRRTSTPFFVWFNSTHMHFRTHVKPASRGQADGGSPTYHDVMIDHDDLVGDAPRAPRRARPGRRHDRRSTRPTTGRT